ncbi:MAG: cache domain-containing protein [Ignavibacteriales bacterium]|nr:cache domain-containing protein [Ignavibacteriales bacterium]
MKLLLSFLLVCIICSVPISGQSKNSTPAEAEAWAKKAIAFYKANGKEKAIAEFNNTKGKFTVGDLYIIMYDMNGKCLAQGSNAKMVGKDLIDMQDADGKYFVKERLEIIKKKGKGWQNYKWTNPTTKKIEAKTMYVEKVEDYIIGCGAYKK